MAAAPFSWIKPEPHGIHIVPADCWVDPSRAVDRALVTHGHADHARGGHGQTVATPETLAIMELRYATRDGATPVAYGETIRLPGGVDATYIPAGHVLGSAQILLEHAGERVIVTGDYKRRHDPTCPPFEVTPCDIFITEATFGLPVFCHPPIEDEMAKLLDRLAGQESAPGTHRRGADHGAPRRRGVYAGQGLNDLQLGHRICLGPAKLGRELKSQ